VWLQWQHLYQRGRTRIYERRTTGIRNFKLDAFLEHEDFVIPPIEEQRTIAHVLRTVQRAKQQTEQVIAAAQELKRSLMTHLFTLGLVSPSDGPSYEVADTEIGRMPAHWSVVALGSVATLASGGTPSKQRADWWSGPVPWASPKDIKTSRLRDTQDHITLEAAHESSRIVPPGTLLVVIRGMILAKDVPVALTDVSMALNQDLKAVVPKPEVDAEFLLYALQRAKPRLRREIGTSAHGTRRIGTQALERLPIPFPPRDEQKRIAKALVAVDQKIAAEEERRDALRTLFDSLLHDLMTARLPVDGLAAEFAL
jgi:type I restriction enzyme S subunit